MEANIGEEKKRGTEQCQFVKLKEAINGEAKVKLIRQRQVQENKQVPPIPQVIRKKVADVSSKDVEDWIKQVVSKKNSKVGERICPYAAKTLKTKAIQIVPGKSNLVDQICHGCNLFGSLALECIIIYIQYKITEKALSQICRKAHKLNTAYAVFYDHPDNNGLHKGVSFSFGKCPLIFVQPLKELKDAQSKLRRTSYYKSWGLRPNDDMFY